MHRSLLAIGAPGKTSSEYSRLSTGAVFLYTNGGNNQTAQWMLETVLFPPAEEHALQFGYSLNCREGLCFIAATASQGEGVVYVYVKGTSDWQMMTKLMPVNSSPIDGFGTSIILYEANSASSIVKQAFSSSRYNSI